MPDLTAALEIASATHSGMVRSHNEDCIAAEPGIGLAVLADGMGGYNAGEVASSIAVKTVTRDMKEALQDVSDLDSEKAERLISEYAAKANAEIYQSAQREPTYAGMGTTLVIALWHNNQVTVGHIGDSRCYRFRGNTLEQITRDHSWLQEQIDSGMMTREEAKYSQNKNLVTRAVGIDPTVEAEVHTYPVEVGDVYLLCSDGLTDMVAEEDMQLILSPLSLNLAVAAEQLVQQANDNGGRDNISVILVQVLKSFPANPAGWLGRLKGWLE